MSGAGYLDSVVFGVGADIAPIGKQYAKVDAETDALAARIKTKTASALAVGQDLGPMRAQFQKVEAEAEALASRIRGKTSNVFFADNLAGSSKIIAARQGILDFVDAQKRIKPAAEEAAAAVGVVTAAVTKGHGSTATAVREFRALFDELSSGRTRQTPGTLAIIATRVLGISGATLAWGVALAAIPALMLAAANSAENAASRVNRALVSSGHASGLRSSDIYAGAEQLDRSTSLSYRGGLDELSAFAGSGLDGRLVGRAAAAVPGYAAGTNQKDDKATEELLKMLEDPAKGAEELSRNFHLLSVDQQEQIRHQVASGQKEAAQSELIDAVNGRFGHLDEATWSLSQAFDHAGKRFSDLWYHTGASIDATFSGRESPNDLTQLSVERRQMADRSNIMHGGVGDMMVPYYNPETLPRDYNTLRSKMAQEDIDSVRGAAMSRDNDAIGAGLADYKGSSGKFDTNVDTLQDKLGQLNWAMNAAIETHSQYTDKIKQEKDAVSTALNNQIDPGQQALIDAEGRRRIASASPRARPYVEAQVRAADARRKALADPSTAQYADTIYGSELSTAGVAQSAQSRQTISETNAAADSAKKIADAYDTSTAAAARARAEGEAHSAWLRGAINDEKSYAAAILHRSEMEARAAFAEQLATMKSQNQGLLAEAGTDGSPAARAAARRHSQAVTATRGLFDNAKSPEDFDKARKALNDYEAQEAQTDTANRTIGSKDTDRGLQQRVDMIRLEISTMGQAQPLREKELADLQTRNELISEGYTAGSEAFNAEYQARVKLNDQIRQGNDELAGMQRQQTQTLDLANQGIGEVGKVLSALSSGHATAHQILTMVGEDLANLIEKLLILGPLENAVTQAVTGKPGTAPSADFGSIGTALGKGIGSLFSSGASDSIDAAIAGGAWANGGAWDTGGNQYMALGDVVSRPTRFRTNKGPAVAGEAGPEGVLPLARGPSGKLGVHAQGMGGHNTIVNQTNHIHPDVSRIARMEAMKVVKESTAGMFDAMKWAHIRGQEF